MNSTEAPSSQKPLRLTVRVPGSVQAKMEAAAAALGVSLNSFIVGTASREAAEVLARERTITLSPRDVECLTALIENPPEPNEYVLRAAAGLKSRVAL
jgi:uncharacterized protein (DUF1778 family)